MEIERSGDGPIEGIEGVAGGPGGLAVFPCHDVQDEAVGSVVRPRRWREGVARARGAVPCRGGSGGREQLRDKEAGPGVRLELADRRQSALRVQGNQVSKRNP